MNPVVCGHPLVTTLMSGMLCLVPKPPASLLNGKVFAKIFRGFQGLTLNWCDGGIWRAAAADSNAACGMQAEGAC